MVRGEDCCQGVNAIHTLACGAQFLTPTPSEHKAEAPTVRPPCVSWCRSTRHPERMAGERE